MVKSNVINFQKKQKEQRSNGKCSIKVSITNDVYRHNRELQAVIEFIEEEKKTFTPSCYQYDILERASTILSHKLI